MGVTNRSYPADQLMHRVMDWFVRDSLARKRQPPGRGSAPARVLLVRGCGSDVCWLPRAGGRVPMSESERRFPASWALQMFTVRRQTLGIRESAGAVGPDPSRPPGGGRATPSQPRVCTGEPRDRAPMKAKGRQIRVPGHGGLSCGSGLRHAPCRKPVRGDAGNSCPSLLRNRRVVVVAGSRALGMALAPARG